MSLYVSTIVVSAQTRPRQAQSTVIDVHAPMVDHVSIAFEDGCFRTVGVRLLNRDRQFAPRDPPGGWIYGNNEIMLWREEYKLDGPPYRVEIETHSLAADFAHEVEVRLEVVGQTMEAAFSDLTRAINAANRPRGLFR